MEEEKIIPDEIPNDAPPIDAQEAPEPKRGRGRPKKNLQTPEADVIPRKPKEGKKVAKEEAAATNQTSEFFAQQVFGMHTLATLISGMDLTITPQGAAQMGNAIYEVVKQYDLTWLNKFTPVMNLIVTTAIVEGPVILKAQQIQKLKHAEKQEAQTLKKPSQGVEAGPPLKVEPQTQGGLSQAIGGLFNPQVISGGAGLGQASFG